MLYTKVQLQNNSNPCTFSLPHHGLEYDYNDYILCSLFCTLRKRFRTLIMSFVIGFNTHRTELSNVHRRGAGSICKHIVKCFWLAVVS